jgi:serine/threonine-protein kinase CLA4
LIFLHEHEIIHRDIKSDNIFVNYNSTGDIAYLSIGDFDRSKIVNNGGTAKTTVGTTSWLAPEVLNSENVKEYTFSVDIWR